MTGDLREQLRKRLDEAEVDINDMGHVWLYDDEICGDAGLKLIERDRALLADVEAAQTALDRASSGYYGGSGDASDMDVIVATARRMEAGLHLARTAVFWLGTPEQDGSAPK